MPALLLANHAQEVQPAGMIRRRHEDLLVRRFRLLEMALLMEANRVIKGYWVGHCFAQIVS